MTPKNLRNFFISIVLPTILAIVFFVMAFLFVILPIFETNMMERKKEMIRELTNSAWSLAKEFDDEHKSGEINLQEAQRLAAEKIGLMRYGEGGKDYFWITNYEPRMIMHPYRRELINKDLNDYEDPHGKKLFVEAVEIVQQNEEGFINYMWQWKDDSTRIVPKLSFVKAYEDWQWIIGTGIYLEDVKSEIQHIKGRLFRISLLIALIIAVILFYIVQQSLKIEHKRRDTEDNLKKSRQKYQSLVEAAVDGTVMLVEGRVVYSNNKFNQMIACSPSDVLQMHFNDVFEAEWQNVIKQFEKPGRSISLETRTKCKEKEARDVVITISKVQLYAEETYIVITKDITRQRQFEKQTENLSEEIQTSLMLMNQPIKHFVKPILTCNLSSTIYEAARKMQRKNQKAIFITNNGDVLGVINDADLRNRVIAANIDFSISVAQVMTSPVVFINENDLLYEAVLKFKNHRISHLAVRNNNLSVIGIFSNQDALDMQRNTLSYLIKEIDISESVHQLKAIYQNVPVIIRALIESGDKTSNITRIISSIADAITRRIIAFTFEEVGPAPCHFAFIGLGSVGRKEQTLATDQDNAIIYENDAENAETYFAQFAEKVNEQLKIVGYKLCKGEVMARNTKWRQPISQWKEYFTEWINNADPQSILDASIFFDFRCIYGEELLTIALRKHVNDTIEGKAVFFQHLASPVSNWKSPSSLFGGLLSGAKSLEDKVFDIKKILFPITSFIRLYSIHAKLIETNSQKRLDSLLQKNTITKEMYEELKFSYNYLMIMRFRSQANQLLNGEIPNNEVNVAKLTDIEITTLKKIFSLLSDLQTKVNFDFKGGA